MSWLTELPIAHRGLHDDAAGVPENSLPAFEAACRAGYAIELDVQPLRDGGAAVFHDEDLLRLTGAKGRIADLKAADLRWTRLAGTREPVPTLVQALELVNGRVPVLIEIKVVARGHKLEQEVRRATAAAKGEFAVQSFHPLAVVWFRLHAPRLPRGRLLPREADGPPTPRGWMTRAARWALDLEKGGLVHFAGWAAEDLPDPAAERLRARGMPVLAWTVRSAAEEARVRPHCDNVIFEGYRPARGS